MFVDRIDQFSVVVVGAGVVGMGIARELSERGRRPGPGFECTFRWLGVYDKRQLMQEEIP